MLTDAEKLLTKLVIYLTIILNLFREGARLRLMAEIAEILKNHSGIYDFDLTASQLVKRSYDINKYIKTGKINSKKTAENYIINSTYLALYDPALSESIL